MAREMFFWIWREIFVLFTTPTFKSFLFWLWAKQNIFGVHQTNVQLSMVSPRIHYTIKYFSYVVNPIWFLIPYYILVKYKINDLVRLHFRSQQMDIDSAKVKPKLFAVNVIQPKDDLEEVVSLFPLFQIVV